MRTRSLAKGREVDDGRATMLETGKAMMPVDAFALGLKKGREIKISVIGRNSGRTIILPVWPNESRWFFPEDHFVRRETEFPVLVNEFVQGMNFRRRNSLLQEIVRQVKFVFGGYEVLLEIARDHARFGIHSPHAESAEE